MTANCVRAILGLLNVREDQGAWSDVCDEVENPGNPRVLSTPSGLVLVARLLALRGACKKQVTPHLGVLTERQRRLVVYREELNDEYSHTYGEPGTMFQILPRQVHWKLLRAERKLVAATNKGMVVWMQDDSTEWWWTCAFASHSGRFARITEGFWSTRDLASRTICNTVLGRRSRWQSSFGDQHRRREVADPGRRAQSCAKAVFLGASQRRFSVSSSYVIRRTPRAPWRRASSAWSRTDSRSLPCHGDA